MNPFKINKNMILDEVVDEVPGAGVGPMGGVGVAGALMACKELMFSGVKDDFVQAVLDATSVQAALLSVPIDRMRLAKLLDS